MSKIAIVYWSGTGNTEAMALAIADGVKNSGAEVCVMTSAEFDASMMEHYDVIAFGCSAMGTEELEEREFAPMFEACEPKLSGKKIALFGSYGWGDGEWMRDWEDRCERDGAIMTHRSIICNEAPDNEALFACKAMGASLA